MQKKLTITIDEDVYEALHRIVGRRHISKFIESLVQPELSTQGLEAGYRAMAADEARESEALDWSEGVLGDVL